MKTIFLLRDKHENYLHKNGNDTTWRYSQAIKFEDRAMANLYIVVYRKFDFRPYEVPDMSSLPKPWE